MAEQRRKNRGRPPLGTHRLAAIERAGRELTRREQAIHLAELDRIAGTSLPLPVPAGLRHQAILAAGGDPSLPHGMPAFNGCAFAYARAVAAGLRGLPDGPGRDDLLRCIETAKRRLRDNDRRARARGFAVHRGDDEVARALARMSSEDVDRWRDRLARDRGRLDALMRRRA